MKNSIPYNKKKTTISSMAKVVKRTAVQLVRTKKPMSVNCLELSKSASIGVWSAMKRYLFEWPLKWKRFYRIFLTFSTQKVKSNILLVCNLLLSTQQATNRSDFDHISFSQVLKNSLSVEKTIPTFCEQCKKFSPTNQYSRVIDLPQILSINCGLTNDKDLTFLKRQMNRNFAATPAPGSTSTSTTPDIGSVAPMKPCRYGLHCSRVDCHFTHPDRYD